MSNLSNDDGIRALPMKAFATRSLKSWKMRFLRGLVKTKHTKPKTQHHCTAKQRNLIKELIQSTLSVQSQGVLIPLHTGGNRNLNEQNKEEREKEREGEEEEGREEDKEREGESERR